MFARVHVKEMARVGLCGCEIYMFVLPVQPLTCAVLFVCARVHSAFGGG